MTISGKWNNPEIDSLLGNSIEKLRSVLIVDTVTEW